MQVHVIPSTSKMPRGSCLECWMIPVSLSPCSNCRPLPQTNYFSEVCARFKRFSSSRFIWEEAVFLFSSAELCSDVPYVTVPLVPAGSWSSDVRRNKDASEVPSLLSLFDHFRSYLPLDDVMVHKCEMSPSGACADDSSVLPRPALPSHWK